MRRIKLFILLAVTAIAFSACSSMYGGAGGGTVLNALPCSNCAPCQ